MKTADFKTALSEIKSELKGVSISIKQPNSIKSYETLKEFGAELLKLEAQGLEFSLVQAWVNDSMEFIETFDELKELFKTSNVQAIRIAAGIFTTSRADYMRTSGPLD